MVKGQMSHPAIKVDNISKEYRIGENVGYKTLRDAIANFTRKISKKIVPPKVSYPGEQSKGVSFWALNNVSFEVQPGEVIGIIGKNAIKRCDVSSRASPL